MAAIEFRFSPFRNYLWETLIKKMNSIWIGETWIFLWKFFFNACSFVRLSIMFLIVLFFMNCIIIVLFLKTYSVIRLVWQDTRERSVIQTTSHLLRWEWDHVLPRSGYHRRPVRWSSKSHPRYVMGRLCSLFFRCCWSDVLVVLEKLFLSCTF